MRPHRIPGLFRASARLHRLGSAALILAACAGAAKADGLAAPAVRRQAAPLLAPSASPAQSAPLLSAPASASSGDTASSPSRDAVRLSAQGAFSLAAPRVGDSLEYRISVEWEDTEVPVVVLAPDSAVFPGFRILGEATRHRKSADGQAIRNHTDFIYRLRAATQGPGKAAALKVRYLTGISHNEEAVYVPSTLIDIGPAPVRLLDMLWVKIVLSLAALAAAVGLGWAVFRFAARRRAQAAPKKADWRPEVETLKSRLRAAQNNPDASQAFLLEMESVAVRFLAEEVGPREGKARFEALADAYLAQGRGGEAAEWDKLRDLFRHARFAGGHKEPHELQDGFRTFRKCLRLQTEDEP